jgi:hypothetical protein
MLGFMLQVLKELDVFDPADVDHAVTALDEEVCALSLTCAILGRVDLLKSNLQSFWEVWLCT